jgi:hypothetical protein
MLGRLTQIDNAIVGLEERITELETALTTVMVHSSRIFQQAHEQEFGLIKNPLRMDT